jgi:hypothetical protein
MADRQAKAAEGEPMITIEDVVIATAQMSITGIAVMVLCISTLVIIDELKGHNQ